MSKSKLVTPCPIKTNDKKLESRVRTIQPHEKIASAYQISKYSDKNLPEDSLNNAEIKEDLCI